MTALWVLKQTADGVLRIMGHPESNDEVEAEQPLKLLSSVIGQ
jgi:hypothetical protein